MRKTLFLSALLAGVAAGAAPSMATDADMPPEFRAATFEVYMGVFGAADTLRSNYTEADDGDPLTDPVTGDLDGTGFSYGLRGGVDYIMDGWLIGAVGDWSYGGNLASDTFNGVEAGVPNLGTLRARRCHAWQFAHLSDRWRCPCRDRGQHR